MVLTHLSVSDVRNYATLEFAPPPGLCVLVGANAQGKSNLLEAIGLLCTGKSFRTSHEREVVRVDRDRGWVSGQAQVGAGTIRLACTLVQSPTGLRKAFTLNGHPVRYGGYLGRARVVTFVPGDMDLVSGPPARRRSLLNAALSQESLGYYRTLVTYTKYLEQKNALLRGQLGIDTDLLATYDERLVATGAAVVSARRTFVAALADEARRAYEQIAGEAAGDGPLEITYAPNVDEPGFAERLAAMRQAEFARRRALVGPHRDDVALRLGGRPLAAFGSQGQQRSAVLALKVAEYAALSARSGEPPLLLLDDVLSELDPQRQASFMSSIGAVEQAFVTSTVSLAGVRSAATYRVAAATLERVA